MLEVKILLLLLVGLLTDAFSFDSAEDGYLMLLQQDPWWGYQSSGENFGNDFQYYFPFLDKSNDPGSFQWYFRPVKAGASQPSSSQSDAATREWPSWLPPVRLIKLPLDEPPAAITNSN